MLDSYLQAIEGRLSANDVTARGQYVEFDRDKFTRLPLIERVQIMVGALKSGATPAMVDALSEVLDLDFVLPEDPNTPPPPAPTSPAPPAPAAVTPPPPPPPAPAAALPAGR